MEASATPTAAQSPGLLTRVLGVLVSPKDTFQRIVEVPQPFGVLFLCAALMGAAQVAPQFTESGRQATLEMQVRSIEQFGQTVTPEMYQRLEERSHSLFSKLSGLLGAFIGLPIIALVLTAICWVFFNTVLGGLASFKQVLAVVTHSYVISALGLLAALPIVVMQGKITMGGPFNLGALAPMLEETSTLARFLSAVSVFSLWGFTVMGIGLGVLYRRSGRNIAVGLIAVFLLLMYGVIALFGSMFNPS